MTDADLRALVRRMRETQKLYFNTRDREVLDRARSLERQVDRELSQPSLIEPDPTTAGGYGVE